eukprot:1403494-Rhodomonas_salina.2
MALLAAMKGGSCWLFAHALWAPAPARPRIALLCALPGVLPFAQPQTARALADFSLRVRSVSEKTSLVSVLTCRSTSIGNRQGERYDWTSLHQLGDSGQDSVSVGLVEDFRGGDWVDAAVFHILGFLHHRPRGIPLLSALLMTPSSVAPSLSSSE